MTTENGNRRRRLIAAGAGLLLVIGITLFWTRFGTAPQGPFIPTAEELQKLALYSQPESWFVEHLQGPREVVDGQTLDAKFQYMLEQMRPAGPWVARIMPMIFATAPGRRWARAAVDREWTLYTKVTPRMVRIEDREIDARGGPLHLRIYHPDVQSPAPLPVLVYHHGGGWVFASVAALDRATQLMANEAQAIVVSVDFRLAPEHPYPAASDDGEDAYLWTLSNAAALGGDAQRVAVGGDSAGGYVAINIVQRQIMAGRPAPRALLLYYPGTGLPQRDGSFQQFGVGYGLDASFIDYILPLVFPDRKESDPRDDLIDPLRAKSLKGFPPTILTTAGFDILRDSGRAFAQRLKDEGAAVHYRNASSLTHSFLQFSGVVPDADEAATSTARLLGATLRGAALPD